MTPRLRQFLSRPKNIFMLTGGLVAVVTVLSWPHFVFAEVVSDTVFNLILSPIIGAMIQMFAALTGYIVGLLVMVAQYPHYINAAPVVTGYPIVRDLANMMFIIALLIIAAGTILRLENYRYNRLLGRLIVMAFLVNLARFITGFFIQTSQVFMLTFVNAFKDIALGNFAYMFGLDKVLTFSQDHTSTTGVALFITLVAGLAMMVVAFSVTLALVVILLVRIVALWILTILSPLAYALRIIPNTEKYASQWWSYFGKYLVTGPVLAFFLWLALAISAASGCNNATTCDSQNSLLFNSNDPQLQNAVANTNQQVEPFTQNLVSSIFDLPTFTTFIVSIIFLIMGMQFASSSGTIGSRFAKQVYEGGLGAGATATGLNYLRDRTIAPVQGWIANRQSARKAGIQDRTQTLEAFGDRTRAAVGRAGIGRGGGEKAQAAAEAYETQRTQRYLQQRGVKNWTHDQVEQEMLTARDPRRRLAMMTELQSRGRLDLSRNDHDSAFETITSQLRLPAADRQKLRQDILRSSLPTMNEGDIRSKMTTARDPEELALYAQDLERRKALDGADTHDQDVVNNVRTALAVLPSKLKEFDDGLKRANPRMALSTVYHNFSNGRNDVSQLVSDIQQGTFNAGNLTRRDAINMIQGLHNQGLTRPQARDLIGNSILDNSRSKDEFNKVTESMTHDVRSLFNSNMVLNPNIAREKKDWLALQGFADEAYRSMGDFNRVMERFINDNSARVAQLAKDGRLSEKTISNGRGEEVAMRTMMDSKRIGKDVLNEMVKNNPELRNLTRDSALRVVYASNSAVDAGGNPIGTADEANANKDIAEQARRDNARREILMDLGQGGTVKHPMSGADASIMDVAYTGLPMTEQANIRKARRRAIKKQLGNWSKLNFDGASGDSKADLIVASTVNQLNTLADKAPDAAQKIAKIKYEPQTRTPKAKWNAGDTIPGTGYTLQPGEELNLNSQFTRLERSDRDLI